MRHVLIFVVVLCMGCSARLYAKESVAVDDSIQTSSPLQVQTDTSPADSASVTARGRWTKEDTKYLFKQIKQYLPRISGILQAGYLYNTEADHQSTFQVKRLRLKLDAPVTKYVNFHIQLEAFNSILSGDNEKRQSGISVMDAFAEIYLHKSFNIRVGQLYLPIGYESYDMSPANLEPADFSDLCYFIVSRNPISYNYVELGCDQGILFFGDFLPSKDRSYHHFSYTASISNGSSPNRDDDNIGKDLMASLDYRPIKYWNFRASFSWGKYSGTVRQATYRGKSLTRFVIGTWYNNPVGFNFRAEYGHMQAHADRQAIFMENSFYALASYRFGKLEPVARFSWYRDNVDKSAATNRNQYLLGANYWFTKSFRAQVMYTRTHYIASSASHNNNRGNADKIQVMGVFTF